MLPDPVAGNEGFCGAYSKLYPSMPSSQKKKVTRVDSTNTNFHSDDCTKSSVDSSSYSNSVKSSPELSKPMSPKVTPEKPIPSKIISKTSKLPLISEKQKSPKLTPEMSKSSTVTCETSKILSKRNKSSNCVPHIQAQPGAQSLVIPEVQEAMKRNDPNTAFQRAAQARLTPNTTVNDILEDPSWLAIMAEFQEDPEAAMIRYKDNAEVRSVMTKLCATLGDNFLNLSTSGKKSEEDVLVEQIMGEPNVREALLSPFVQRIMELVKAGRNDVVRRLMAEADDEGRRHIRTLLDFGLLSFSC